MKKFKWVDKGTYWELGEFGKGPCVSLEPRPSYCDRGHWIAKVDGIPTIDFADCFPRYFMDLGRAKAECEEWLEWRLNVKKKPIIVKHTIMSLEKKREFKKGEKVWVRAEVVHIPPLERYSPTSKHFRPGNYRTVRIDDGLHSSVSMQVHIAALRKEAGELSEL